MTEDVVKVVFRLDHDGDVFALFPDEDFDGQGNCTAYAHIGQHSVANYTHTALFGLVRQPSRNIHP